MIWRQVPHPGHDVAVQTVRTAGADLQQPVCRTCNQALGPARVSFGEAHTRLREHVDGVRVEAR